MVFSEYVPGLILIGMGLLAAKFPNLINTIPKEERDRTDMAAVGRMVRKWSIGLGVIQIVGSFLLLKFSTWEIKVVFDVLLIMVGVIIMATKSQMYKL